MNLNRHAIGSEDRECFAMQSPTGPLPLSQDLKSSFRLRVFLVDTAVLDFTVSTGTALALLVVVLLERRRSDVGHCLLHHDRVTAHVLSVLLSRGAEVIVAIGETHEAIPL